MNLIILFFSYVGVSLNIIFARTIYGHFTVEKRQEIRVKKYGGFGLVINNILGREADFKPRVEFSLGVPDDKDLEEIDEVEGIWTHEQVRTITLENNDHVLESLDFTVPAGTKRGDYYFNVFVCYDGDESSEFCPSGFKSLYGAVQQITINVP